MHGLEIDQLTYSIKTTLKSGVTPSLRHLPCPLAVVKCSMNPYLNECLSGQTDRCRNVEQC
eukprot:2240199-Pleurochrysis_carterae.AAC.1